MAIWIPAAGGDPIIDSNGDIAECANCPCGDEVDCTPCCECHYFTFDFTDGTNSVSISIKITPTNAEADCCCEYSVVAAALTGGGTLDFTGKMVRDLFFFTLTVTGSTVGTFSLPWQTVEALWANCCGQVPETGCNYAPNPALCVEPQTLLVCADDNDEVTINLQVYPFCTPCTNNDPQMCLTVFDADYAGGNLTWCGEIWTPAEVQAGASKTVCPTSYDPPYKIKLTPFPGAYQYVAGHRWLWATGTLQSLNLSRTYSKGVSGTNCIVQQRRNSVDLRGQDFLAFSFKFQGGCAVFYTSFGGLTGANVTGYAMPTYSAYQIPPGAGQFFGSHTIGGVTYTWTQGAGWP